MLNSQGCSEGPQLLMGHRKKNILMFLLRGIMSQCVSETVWIDSLFQYTGSKYYTRNEAKLHYGPVSMPVMVQYIGV